MVCHRDLGGFAGLGRKRVVHAAAYPRYSVGETNLAGVRIGRPKTPFLKPINPKPDSETNLLARSQGPMADGRGASPENWGQKDISFIFLPLFFSGTAVKELHRIGLLSSARKPNRARTEQGNRPCQVSARLGNR